MRRGPLIPPRNNGVLLMHRSRKSAQVLQQAETLHKRGQLIPALRLYRIVADVYANERRHPVMLRAMFLAALCAYQMRLYGDAAALMEAVRSAQWENPDVHYNLGLMYDAVGALDQAAESYRVALALKHDNPATETNLGNVLRQMGDEAGAELCYQRVLERAPTDPEARYNLSHVLLVRGDLARGFQEFEQRWACEGYVAEYGRPDLTQPRWTPDSTARRVLVHAEQGFGDTLQFIRYLPVLVERGLEVTFEVQPQLRRLLQQLERPRLTIISRGDPIPAHDAQIPLLSLTYALGTDAVSIPPLRPIHAEPGRLELPEFDGIRIGVCWAGNPNHHNNRNRSAALRALAPLFHTPRTHWVSLQVGHGAADFAIAAPHLLHWERQTIMNRLTDVSGHLRDFADTAALIASLDLVITVDTSIAHLAATLGRPTWLLLPHLAEWRWQQGRPDSPWYPTARLFRQPTRGDWLSVAKQLRTELEAA